MEKSLNRTQILEEINNLLYYRFVVPLEELFSDPDEIDDLINYFHLIRYKWGEPHSTWFKLVFGRHFPICNRTNDYLTKK